MKRSKTFFRRVVFAMIIFGMFLSMYVPVYADDFNATVSSASAVTGENISITVTFSSGTNIGAYAMSMSYDSNVLEYVSGADGGGGGTLQFYNDYVNQTQKSYTITFKAISAGTANFEFQTISTPCDIDANDMTVKASGGSVTVEAPRTLSSDNYLSTLNVSLVYEDGTTEAVNLNPGFNKDTTEYNLSVKSNISRISLDANTSDSKATVKVSGTKLESGKNTTVITVTAEDGTTRKYKIYTEKEAEETTPSETTTEPPTETTTQEETTENIPLVLPEVTINGKQYQINNVPEDYQAPEGYEAAPVEYQDMVVNGLQGLSTKLVLVYAVEKESQEGQLLIYNKENTSFSLYIPLAVLQQIYTVLDMPEDMELPFKGSIGEEFQYTDLLIEGKTVKALSYGAGDIYLVYALNRDGIKQLYYYDKTENTMLRYVYSELENNILNNSSVTANVGIDMAERKLFEKRIEKRNYIIIGLAAAIVVLIAGIVVVLVKANKKGQSVNKEEAKTEEVTEECIEEEETPLAEDEIDQEIDNILSRK